MHEDSCLIPVDVLSMLQTDSLRLRTTVIRWRGDCCVFLVTWTARCARPEVHHRARSYVTRRVPVSRGRRCSRLRRRGTIIRPVRRRRRRSEFRRIASTAWRPPGECCHRQRRSTRVGERWRRRTSPSYRDSVSSDRIRPLRLLRLRRRPCCPISTSRDCTRRQRSSSSRTCRDLSSPPRHIARITRSMASPPRLSSPPRPSPPTFPGSPSRRRPS